MQVVLASSTLSVGVAVWAFLFLSHVSLGAAGVQLDGAGSSNSAGLLAVWAQAYRYSRDDVRINYSQPGLQVALNQYTQGVVDFLATDRGVFDDAAYSTLVQLPLAAQAMAMSYNIPTLNSTDPTLIMNRTVLADVWCGKITMWNDDAIRELNPEIESKLPAEPIVVGFIDSAITISFVEVLKQTLESFGDDFRTAFAAANRTFANLPAAQNGTLRLISGASPARVAWMKQTNYSMTFVNYAETVGQVSLMRMYNKAGFLVEPSVTTVQSAMADFESEYDNSEFTVDILDANGTNSWPMAYVTFLSLYNNGSFADCTNVKELLNFVSWIDTNDEASSAAIAANVAPLDIGLRKKLLKLLNNVQCNGAEAFSNAFLVGVGAELSLMTSWQVSFSNDNDKLKYYQETSTVAKEQLVQYNSDFGVSINSLTDGWVQQMSDVGQIPTAAFALAPGYNIPQLGSNRLVLNCETLAAIYQNKITMWNDTRIKSINSPVVAALLPAQPIVVIVLTESSAVTQLFTYMLNATVPSFADEVGAGGQVYYPVQGAFNRSLNASSGEELVSLLRSTQYSIATWMHQPLLQSRSLGVASMINSANVTVRASMTSVASAVTDFIQSGAPLTYTSLILGKGTATWPLATFASVIYRQRSMTDCNDAAALAEFLWWTQFDSGAQEVSDSQSYVLASTNAALKSLFLDYIKNFTCSGVTVSSYAGCIDGGKLCSDQGTCSDGVCQCSSGRTGQYCEQLSKTSVSDQQLLAIILGTVIPLGICCMLLVGAIVFAMHHARARKRDDDDWEIRYDELEVGVHLGTGGFGEVYRATWKGTEVAVKVMASERITKDMERRFKDEVRVMTALRHPNVVLFMAASTKAPRMCIVMEYMALGCLFDLLHNDLIPEIPFALKAKMAYQASKGMHFLHSSGIVHRDLKSLNLLLDTKWNVKVSDFGLTKFKEDIKGKGVERDMAGSVHWTAPEVLNESAEVDLILADVYSFGIILWELLTRQQPYFGLSPSAVAIAVIRDGLRPHLPENLGAWPAEYDYLITSCWHHDPTIRPTFLEIMTRLSSMHGGSTSAGATTYTSKTSSSSGQSGMPMQRKHSFGSWTLPSATNSSRGSSHSSRNSSAAPPIVTREARPPEGEVTIVFTDITRAASLWEFNASAMRDATLLHNEILRHLLLRHRGYEVVFIKDKNSGEGSFCMAFQQATDALAWCTDVQRALLTAAWPEELLGHPGAAEEWGDTDNRVLFKGLRVRMGVHLGTPRLVRDPMTRRMEYIGPVVNAAARITALTHGGQIVMSRATYINVKDNLAPQRKILTLGRFEMPDSPQGSRLYELKIEGLEGRFFGGVAIDDMDQEAGKSTSTHASSNRSTISGSSEVQTVVGEGMMFKEDTFLTSANLCRWIIDFGEIQVGRQIGLGSYGTVYRGKWKGVEVAVKRFIKQKLDERRMLEFRAEMAFLSELHHPNIVLFIGACVKKPNLCIVTEFMKQGSLKDILSDNTIKLTWQHKLGLLRSAALGINYLHSLHPVIVHRDIKPSNLLVDENWNVKVADFGFARIKEENATMTRCGTPCWTAPEVIRGDKYDELADVFSFGIVMWQVVTRKEPFAGRNFMGVSLDVLEGKRPQIPNDCPDGFAKMLKRCWHASPFKRPRMDDVLVFLDQLIDGDRDDDDAYQPNVV